MGQVSNQNKEWEYNMKKIITLFFTIILLAQPVSAKQKPKTSISVEGNAPIIEGQVTFDWIGKTQLQRDENIKDIQNKLFNEKTVLKYPAKKFKEQYKEFSRDKDSMQHYMAVSSGIKEDSDNFYAGFFLKNGLLIAYGIQKKSDLKHIYYYDAMGHLKYIDMYSDNYPKFPYYALQYSLSGKLIGTIYFVSSQDQYIFNPDKTFNGRWFKENLYNRNARIILTRSNY